MGVFQRNKGIKAILAIAVVAAAFAGQAQAGTCKTVTYGSGITQVFGTVKGSGTSEDSAFCSAVNTCPSASHKVEVYGAGVASQPGSVVAVSSAATLASGDEAIASCEATLKQGKKGYAGICHDAVTAPAEQGAAASADCSLFVSTPANGSAAANATCFCGK